MWSNLTCEASLLPVRTFEEFGRKLKQHFIFRNVETFLLLAEIYEEQEGISVECQLPALQQYVLSSQQVWAFQGEGWGLYKGRERTVRALYRRWWDPCPPYGQKGWQTGLKALPSSLLWRAVKILAKVFKKQECIPVGCVSSAAVAICLEGMSA